MAPADDAERPDDAPEDAFALVGNETRIEILRALGAEPYTGLSFSELRSRVAPDMDSGQFNYHLKQLVGRFVEREDDGYVLRQEGVSLYRTIRAGTFTRQVDLDPFDPGFDCHFCGTAVEARYADGILEMDCPGCGYHYMHSRLPPSALEEGSPESALELIDQYQRHGMLAVSRGVCPICVNGLELEFVPGEELWLDSAARLDVFVGYSCDHCGHEHYLTVGLSLLYHPSLVAFFHDHGTDITSVPHWELGWAMTNDALTVHSTDPWEVTLRVTEGGDTLELTVDGELTVQ